MNTGLRTGRYFNNSQLFVGCFRISATTRTWTLPKKKKIWLLMEKRVQIEPGNDAQEQQK